MHRLGPDKMRITTDKMIKLLYNSVDKSLSMRPSPHKVKSVAVLFPSTDRALCFELVGELKYRSPFIEELPLKLKQYICYCIGMLLFHAGLRCVSISQLCFMRWRGGTIAFTIFLCSFVNPTTTGDSTTKANQEMIF